MTACQTDGLGSHGRPDVNGIVDKWTNSASVYIGKCILLVSS